MRSIAVLVISCPCAMGLATPAAIAVGLGRAALCEKRVKGRVVEAIDESRHLRAEAFAGQCFFVVEFEEPRRENQRKGF